MSEALGYGPSRYMLYALNERGVIEQVSRGVYRKRKKCDTGKLLEYARVCRVENVMRPYLEAVPCWPTRC